MAFNIFIYNIFIFIHNNSIKATTMDVVVLSFYRIYRLTGSKPGLVRLKDLLAFIDIHWRQLRKNQYD